MKIMSPIKSDPCLLSPKSLYISGARPDRFSRTDLIFLCVFPVMFLLFNVAYWTAIHFWRWGGSQTGYQTA